MPKKNAIYERLMEFDEFKDGQAVTAENFVVALSLLYPDNLRKEMFRKTDDPSVTLYRWYYDFLKAGLSSERLIQDVSSDNDENAAHLSTMDIFGDLKEDFLAWWRSGGKAAFTETGTPKIDVVNNRPEQANSRKDMGLLVVIPMNLSREGILEQINFALDVYHPGEDLRRHEHSTASLKLYPRQRTTQTDYKALLEIWKGAEVVLSAGENPIWWKIYCDAYALGDVKAKLEKLDREDIDTREKFSKIAKKMYQQANRLVRNSLIGKFPKDT